MQVDDSAASDRHSIVESEHTADGEGNNWPSSHHLLGCHFAVNELIVVVLFVRLFVCLCLRV